MRLCEAASMGKKRSSNSKAAWRKAGPTEEEVGIDKNESDITLNV